MPRMTPVPTWQPSRKELHRERHMESLLSQFNVESDPNIRRALMSRYNELHEQRSPEYVALLERKKGE